MSRGDVARFFLALADETRLGILTELRRGDRSVGELVDALQCPQPKVSRHLKVLKDAGLVRDRRDGRRVIYGWGPAKGWGREARAWVESLDGETPGSDRTVPAAPRPRRGGDLETHLL